MRWALVCSAVSLAGCYGGGAFHCESNDQCSSAGTPGVCQPDSFCSFPDALCQTGQRYGTSSGPSSGQCVGGGPIDASTEPSPSEPGIDAQECFGDQTSVCIHPPPSQPLALAPTIHTDTDCMMTVPQTGGLDLCVFYGTTITAPQDVRATGSRPLVLVASDSISIDNTIDVSSKRADNTAGAASNASQCNAPTAAKSGAGGGGGGGGGSFVGKGGDGGEGDQNGGKNNGGNAGNASPPALIRGGCPGGVGGDGPANGSGGAFGPGGGAVYLIALNEITIAGNIFASGAAGAGGGVEAGAGGAGSGGMVGFDATTITVTGIVAANGGGGGGGGSTSMGPGGAGGDGTTTSFNQRAAAGLGTGTNKGDGGAGTDDATHDADDGHNADGGAGAGGGGVGIVWLHGAFTGTKVSPTPTNR